MKKGSFLAMQSITSGISVMLVLFLLGLMVFLGFTANNLSVYVREHIALTLTLSDDMKESQVLAYRDALAKERFAKEVVYISKEDALKEQTEAMGTDPAEFLGHNPFPAILEMKLNAEYANSDSLKWISAQIKEETGVLEIAYPQDLLDSVNQNLRKAGLVLLICAGLLTLISFVLINNTIRLHIYAKRFLIHTMRLVGAKWGFIRRPFVLRSVVMGVVAALLADAALYGLVYVLMQYEPDLCFVITNEVLWMVMGIVLLLGVLLTWLCALFSVNRYLNMRTGALYR